MDHNLHKKGGVGSRGSIESSMLVQSVQTGSNESTSEATTMMELNGGRTVLVMNTEPSQVVRKGSLNPPSGHAKPSGKNAPVEALER